MGTNSALDYIQNANSSTSLAGQDFPNEITPLHIKYYEYT